MMSACREKALKKPQQDIPNRLITGFGSASLSQSMILIVRSSPDVEHVVVTVSPERERILSESFRVEGLGNIRTTTFPRLASEFVGCAGPAAVRVTQRMLVFLEALRSIELPTEWRTYEDPSQGAGTLFDILDSLRSASLRTANLKQLQDKSSAATTILSLTEAYEEVLSRRGIADSHDLIERATSALSEGTSRPAGHYLFDCFHDSAPDEFGLAVAIAQAGADCAFLYDPTAPPPPRRAVVGQIETELVAQLPGLKRAAAPQPPGFEHGKGMAEGSLKGTPELLQFNDLASEYRGLAARARHIVQDEGVQEQDLAFYFPNESVQNDLLRYELQRAGLSVDKHAVPGRKAFLREMKLVVDLLAEPERADLRARALSAGLAESEFHLQEALGSVLSQSESASFSELVQEAVKSFFQFSTEAEDIALGRYVEMARQFEVFAGSGAHPADLHWFASTIELLFAGEWPHGAPSSFFIAPEAPPARFYDTVFLPCLVSETTRTMPFPPGVRELMPKLGLLQPGPIHLPGTTDAQERERWEAGSAAASAPRVVLSFHRQKEGRRVEPVPWLRENTASAELCSIEICETPRRSIPVDAAATVGIPAPPILSVTSIKQYVMCPHSFFLAHVLKVALPPNERMKLGSLVHRTLARFHSPGESNFTRERMKHLLEEEAGKEAVLPESLAEADTLLSAYAADDALACEQTLETEYPFQMDFAGASLSGRMDRIIAVPGGVGIIDYKMSGSGKVRKHKNSVVNRLDDVQLPLYVLAARGAGMEVVCFSYIYLNYDKTGLPARVTLRLDESGTQDAIGEAELEQSLERVEDVVAEIIAGREMYERGEDAPCLQSPDRCDHAAMCSLMVN